MLWTSPLSLRLRGIARRLGLTRILGGWVQRRGYEDQFGTTLLATVQSGDVVWDVGANVGLYTDRFLSATGPTGKVIAFEPAAECHAALMERFAGKPSFSTLNIAVGANDGTVVMEMASAALAATHRVLPNAIARNPQDRTVPLRSAKSICAESPDWFPNVVKVDVEGHEGDVFDGFGDLLFDKRLRAIGIEVHFGVLNSRGEDETPARIERLLKTAGFVLRWTDPSHFVAVRSVSP